MVFKTALLPFRVEGDGMNAGKKVRFTQGFSHALRGQFLLDFFAARSGFSK